MSHAETCPVCLGKGRIYDPASSTTLGEPCHGCGGLGWVTVGTEYPVYPVYYTPNDYCTCHLKGKTTADIPCFLYN